MIEKERTAKKNSEDDRKDQKTERKKTRARGTLGVDTGKR